MKKHHLLNRMETGRRGLSLLVTFLTLLLPQSLSAARYDTYGMPTEGNGNYTWSVYKTVLEVSSDFANSWIITPGEPLDPQEPSVSVESTQYSADVKIQGSATFRLDGYSYSTRKLHKVALSGLQNISGKDIAISGTITVTLKNTSGTTLATFTQDPDRYYEYNLAEPVAWNAENYIEIAFDGCSVYVNQLNVFDANVDYATFSWPNVALDENDGVMDNIGVNGNTVTCYSFTSVTVFKFPITPNENRIIQYSSSNEDVATVAYGGVVTAKAEGTTTITATFYDSDDYFKPTPDTYSYTLNVTAEEAQGYDLFIYGTQVTEANAGNILPGSQGSASFDVATNTLMLNGIEVPTGIVTGLNNLIIKVKGNCKFYEEGPQSVISYEGQGTGTLTILKDETAQDECSLTLNCYASDAAPVIAGFSSFNYDNFYMVTEATDVQYNASQKQLVDYQGAPVAEVLFQEANLFIGTTQVTDANAGDVLGDGTVSFSHELGPNKDARYKLVLEDAAITSPILVGLDNLTIDVHGDNTITTSGPCIQQLLEQVSPFLSFTSLSDQVGSLTLTNTDDNMYYGVLSSGFFGEFNISKELALVLLRYGDYSSNTYYFTAGEVHYAQLVPSLGVRVGDMQVYAGNAGDVLGDGTVSFDADSHMLTLENAYISGDVGTTLDELDINVIGNNTIDKYSDGAVFVNDYGESNVQIKVISTAQQPGCLSLHLNYNNAGFVNSDVLFSAEDPFEIYGDLNATSNAYVMIGEYVNYELVVDNIRVVPANASNITNKLNGDKRPIASYDEATNTLTLDNATFYYYWTNNVAVKSDLTSLNVKLIGENIVTVGSNSVVFDFTDVAASQPTLTFTTEEVNGIYGSLQVKGASSMNEISDYNIQDITSITNYNGVSGWVYSETNSDLKIWYQVAYGIIVTKGDVSVIVNDYNRNNVLDDAEATVQFDGHNRLVLNDADLTHIEVTANNGLPIVDPQNKLKGLEIYLEGSNTITNPQGNPLESLGATATTYLKFLTGSDAPGTLTCTSASAVNDANPFPGFIDAYNNNLTPYVSGNSVTVRTPLELIVDAIGTPSTIEYGTAPTQTYHDVIIEKVLYTLDDDGTSSSPDGFDSGTGGSLTLVINSVMTDLQVKESDALIPGSDLYAENFNGLTFLVPCGTGEITLRNVITATGYAFHVRVGGQTPMEVVNNSGQPETMTIPYACSEDSYVKIYLVQTGLGNAPALADSGSHRAGPKATISGGIGGMSVTSNYISNPPSASTAYKIMGAGDWGHFGNHITVNSSDVTDLENNAFGFAVTPALAMGANRTAASHVTYIDARQTSITGKSFSRTAGAFVGVPEETFIYLPAGNTAEGKNFVIGGVCNNLELDADSEKEFEMASDFTAGQAVFTRSFNQSADETESYTFILPYALNPSVTAGDFFTFDHFDNATGTVVLNKILPLSGSPTKLNLAANTAYIFRPAATGTLETMNGVSVEDSWLDSDPADETESEGLHGVYKYHMWNTKPSNVYCYSATDKGGIKAGEFVKVGEGTHIKPFRAYLRINTSSSAPEYLSINWGDGTTSIIPLEKGQVHQDPDGWYTISGFRLPAKPTAKGLYINNGNKVVIK